MRLLLSSDKWARQSVHATHLAPTARVTVTRPLLVLERALFLIFALQEMKVGSARFALPHDFPTGEGLIPIQLERIACFHVQKTFRAHQRHGQSERLVEQIAVERWVEKNHVERSGGETRREAQAVGLRD